MMNSGGMMRSSLVLLLAALIAAVLPGLAFSQDTYFQQYLEFNTLGGGARAAGMGGAYLGISEGEYAFAWNPAMMAFAEKPSIGLQFNSAADKFSFDHVQYSNLVHSTNMQQAQSKRSHFNMNYSGFVVPFSLHERQWAVGGGFHNVQDMDFKFETPGVFNLKDVFSQKEGVDAISVAIGGKVTENFGIGITVNDYIRGGVTDQFWGNYAIYQYSGNPIPDTVDYWNNFDTHYSGINFDIGLAGEYSIVKGSVIVHTPYDLKENVKMTSDYMIPPIPTGIIDRYTSTTSIPLSYSLGLSAKPVQNLTMDFDFDGRPMSKANIKKDWEMVTIPDTSYTPNWENLNQFRIGAEYTFNAGFAKIPIRIGFRNDPSVQKELKSFSVNDSGAVSQLVYGNQDNTNIITFGSGLHFEKAWIDIAYQLGNSSYSTIVTQATSETFQNKRDYSRLFISGGMNF